MLTLIRRLFANAVPVPADVSALAKKNRSTLVALQRAVAMDTICHERRK
jgi:hypothetical protein